MPAVNFKFLLNYSQREKFPQGDQRKEKNKTKEEPCCLTIAGSSVTHQFLLSLHCNKTNQESVSILIIQLEDLHFLCVGCYWRLRIKNVLLLFTKNQHVGLWLIVHVTSKFFNNYLRVLMSKFRLDGLYSDELCYLYIYGEKLKIMNMKSNVRLTQLNCNDFISARRK